VNIVEITVPYKKFIYLVHDYKERYDKEEASRQSANAEHALESERAADEEFEKTEQQLANATTEEEKEQAKKASSKAKKKALKYKERRLRSTLKAAANLRSKPRIDASVEEAKAALPEIPSKKKNYFYDPIVVVIQLINKYFSKQPNF